MGSRYMFIVFYVFLEHHLSRGDYLRPEIAPNGKPGAHTRPQLVDVLGGARPAAPHGANGLVPGAQVRG
jgi:hypothetical protein